jgi:outer membrane protein OmpA-like peptidoglycan-associated protein
MKFVFTCILLAVVAIPLQARSSDPDAPGRKEKKADLNVFAQNFSRAEKYYFDALNAGVGKVATERINLKLADLYYQTRQYDKAEEYYEKTIHNPLSYTPRDVCNFLDVLVREQKFRRAEEVSRLYLDVSPYSEDVRFVNQQKGLNGLIKYMLSDSSQYALKLASFSSEISDFWTLELGEEILFIRSDQFGGKSTRDFIKGAQYYLFDGTSIKPYGKVSSTLQAGPAAISPDGKTMLYTDNRYSNRLPRKVEPGEVVTNALVISQLTLNSKTGKWEKPTMLFKDREDVSYCHPSFSSNGQYFFFASNMPGGYGGMDLYVSKWDGKGWGSPVNLGPEVNTSGDEVYPLVQGERLLFSSNGHVGLGSQDVYYAILNASLDGVIKGSLRHMPYPINTSSNDYAMMFSSDRDGYVSSDRPNGLGFDDIYRFVRNSTSLEGLGELGIDRGDFLRTEDGRFIPVDVASQIGVGQESKPEVLQAQKDLITGKAEADLRVFFDYNDANLNKVALKVLNKFVEEYGVVAGGDIAIVGFTDEIGTEERNQALSERRAESVKNYLVSKGYSAASIDAKGEGQIKLSKEEEISSKDRINRLAPARKVEIKLVFIEVVN